MCAVCGGGFHQQSLIFQRLQQWKYSRILTQEGREVWVLAMVFPAPQGATEPNCLGLFPLEGTVICPAKPWYSLDSLAQQWACVGL